MSRYLLLALVLLNGIISGQGFSNLYYGNRPSMLFGALQEANNNYYITGVTTAIDSIGYQKKGVIGKINSSGVLDFFKVVNDSLPFEYEFFWNSLKSTSDGYFIVSGEVVDSVNKIFLIKFDTAGNILANLQFNDSSLQIFQARDIVELPGRGYLIAINSLQAQDFNQVMIIRCDLAGNILNTKKYPVLFYDSFPWVLTPLSNGNYLVGAIKARFNLNPPTYLQTRLLEIDTMGNWVREWIDPDNKTFWPNALKQTADSGWVLVRNYFYYQYGANLISKASIVKLSKGFTKEWEYQLGDTADIAYTSFNDVEITSDGKYIACGITPIWGNDSAYCYGWIVKFDSDGTVLWDRKYVAYERFGTLSYLRDLDILPNGDLIACGELRFTSYLGVTPIQQGWILKVDSNGCLIEGCTVGWQELDVELEAIKVFPNPFSTQLTFETSNSEATRVVVCDVFSRVVLERVFSKSVTLNTEQLAAGVYFYEVRDKVGSRVVGKGKVVRQ